MSELAIRGGKLIRTKSFSQWPCADEKDMYYLNNALKKSSWWRDMGHDKSLVDKWEQLFSHKHGSQYGIAVTNGTASLNVAVKALKIDKGSEMIVTSYTYVASAFCVLNAGLVPVFVDIDPQTYNIDPDLIEEAITEKTKGIILVHFGGNPVDFDKIMPIARKYNLFVIEDCAHAHGAEWRNKPVGSWGDLGCFSFHAAKNLTCGEGGFVTTSNKLYYERCWMFHNMGRSIRGEWYNHKMLGDNLRFNSISAALLLSQYEKFNLLQNRRKENMYYLYSLLQSIPFLKPLPRDERVTVHGLHLFICRYHSELFHGIPRHRFVSALQAEGIPCHIGYRFPLYDNKPLQKYKRQCPNAEIACFKEAVWFDQWLFLGDQADIRDIFDAIVKIQKNYIELERGK